MQDVPGQLFISQLIQNRFNTLFEANTDEVIAFVYIGLKGLFHPACLARVVSWFAFVVAIFMAHENGDNKGKPRDDTCKECWMKQTL